jgi:hypothetical protein
LYGLYLASDISEKFYMQYRISFGKFSGKISSIEDVTIYYDDLIRNVKKEYSCNITENILSFSPALYYRISNNFSLGTSFSFVLIQSRKYEISNSIEDKNDKNYEKSSSYILDVNRSESSFRVDFLANYYLALSENIGLVPELCYSIDLSDRSEFQSSQFRASLCFEVGL